MADTPAAACVARPEGARPAPSLELARRLWREHLAALRFQLGAILLFVIGVSAATSAYPLVVRYALERYEARDFGVLVWIPLVVIVVTLAKAVTLYGQVALTNVVASRVTLGLQERMFGQLLRADVFALSREPAAALAQRFATDLAFVQEAVSRASTSLVRDSVMVLALLVAMVVIDWQLALIALLCLPLAAWPVAVIGRKLRDTARRTAEQSGGMAATLTEALAGTRLVKSYALEDHMRTRAQRTFDELFRLRVRAANQAARVEPTLEVLGGAAVAGLLLLVGWRIGSGAASVGDFAGFVTAFLVAAQPARSLGNVNAVLQQGFAALERVFALIDEQPKIVDPPGAPPLRVGAGELEFADVHVRYPDGTPALQGVTLTVPGGATVALVGPSGAGKSTLFGLVPRFYDAAAGRVRIDGQDVRSVQCASLRAAVALVSQDVTLFDDTVAANIAYGRPGATPARIEAAARAAAAHGFIEKLPQGYATRVGPGGSGLSGGERQRVAIARALLKDAPVLLLDEATSALDGESERLVQEAMRRLKAGRTTLVIAHRLSTVHDADRIVVLDRGRIVEQGRHEELLAAGGLYARLYGASLQG